ncbi:MAG: molecular chaperone DnaJ [Clostridium sp.]|nr:molecular chaperone DnaJ [Clostridium sp.]
MYFKNVSSFEDLKSQYRVLAKKNHPDAGGDPETMKAINREYDTLFPIWQHRHNQTAETPDTETASGSRVKFYTQNGWAGDRYDPEMSTKEVAARVRAYVKETYPTYKFSVRYSHASMCSEVHVELKEAPHDIYLGFDDLDHDQVIEAWTKAIRNSWVKGGTLDDQEMAELRKVYEEVPFMKVYTEEVDAMVKDIDREVKSYQYDDCDGMIDYFNVNFYWFGVKTDWKGVKIVPRTPRLKESGAGLQTAEPKTSGSGEPAAIGQDYEIRETQHTKTGEKIFVVKLVKKVGRDEYLKIAERMKGAGGYYSRFVHGFVFKEDPSEFLKEAA